MSSTLNIESLLFYRKENDDIELLPLITGVDVKIVAAPAIVYKSPCITEGNSTTKVLYYFA